MSALRQRDSLGVTGGQGMYFTDTVEKKKEKRGGYGDTGMSCVEEGEMWVKIGGMGLGGRCKKMSLAISPQHVLDYKI